MPRVPASARPETTMQRPHPFLSPTGITLTIILLIIIGVLIWRTGGRMFSPGQLTAKAASGENLGGVASHADIDQCARCHRPLDSLQANLCMDCHVEIQLEVTDQAGPHSRFENVQTCFACHSDHQGRDFDPTLAARDNFDHSLASFNLVHHQFDYDAAPLTCTDCHTNDTFAAANSGCEDCHAAEDAGFTAEHIMMFGASCLDCHDGVDRMTDFDHDATDFPLTGGHTGTSCAGCHTGGGLTAVDVQCAACHEEPSVHAGLFSASCETCHAPDGWLPAILEGTDFDHEVSTGFSLNRHLKDYAGQPVSCSGCHVGDFGVLEFDLRLCGACHTRAAPEFMAEHVETFGSACLECHDGVDRMHAFDHATVFVLDGAHVDLECAACHLDRQFSGTPADCAGCHAEPAIHAGVFGLQCQACHTTTAWTPANLQEHTFPLDHGGEGIIECLTCHPATYTQFTCDACHDPVEMLEEHNKEDIFNIAGQCAECHPTGLKEEGESDDD